LKEEKTMDLAEEIKHDAKVKVAAADALIAAARDRELHANAEAALAKCQARTAAGKYEAEIHDLRRQMMDLQSENDALKDRITHMLRADGWRRRSEEQAALQAAKQEKTDATPC
jgi:hypothetical protein